MCGIDQIRSNNAFPLSERVGLGCHYVFFNLRTINGSSRSKKYVNSDSRDHEKGEIRQVVAPWNIGAPSVLCVHRNISLFS